MQGGCASVGGTGPHPALSSADMLTGFCPWWRWSKSGNSHLEPWVGDGSWGIAILLLIRIVVGYRAPHHCTEGWLGALPSSSAHSPPWRTAGLGFGLVGPQSTQHFHLHCISAGISGEGCFYYRAKMAEHWAGCWTRSWAHSCSVGLPRCGTFWSPVLIRTLDYKGGASHRRCLHSL